MSHQIAAVLLPSLAILCQLDQPATTAPTAGEIRRAVEELGDEHFMVRQRASRLLWHAGNASRAALKKAIQSDDPEVVVRARRILNDFRYGIYPDTPDQLLVFIKQFRYGDLNARHNVLKKLMEMGEIPTVMKLLEADPSEDMRAELTNRVVNQINTVVPHLLIAGDSSTAERLLDFASERDRGMGNYAVYYLLRSRIDEKIAQTKARLAQDPNENHAKLLVHMLRAKGDLSAARSVAEKSPDSRLMQTILVDRGDWKELARLEKEAAAAGAGQSGRQITHLGCLAAFQRLAGSDKKCEETVAAIKKLADEQPGNAQNCARALLVNDRFQDAIDILREQNNLMVFDLLCRRLQFREALSFEGVNDPKGPYTSWFKGIAHGPKSQSKEKTDAEKKAEAKKLKQRFASGLRVARGLCRLGEKKQAIDLFGQLARAAKDDSRISLHQVCEAESKVGLIEQAFEHGAVALGKTRNRSVFRALFPGQEQTADVWWQFFCQKYTDDPPETTLNRMCKLLHPDSKPGSEGQFAEQLIREAEEVSQQLDHSHRVKWLTAIGEVCVIWGRREAARAYFDKAVEFSRSKSLLLRIGDLLAEELKWEQAAESYRLAWEKDRRQPLTLYLLGRAVTQAGRAAEGRKLINLALLLPLANTSSRHLLAGYLEQRGYHEAAVGQWEFTVRTGSFYDWATGAAAQKLGDDTQDTDDLKAATCWERYLLGGLRTNRPVPNVQDYLQLRHLIHKAHARNLIAAGQLDQAIQRIRLALAALPGEVQLAEELVPQLEKSKRPAEADELFTRVFDANLQVINDFPSSASHHNNLGWLAARCGRKLDEALLHANQAVKLVPDNPVYIDTLAEVCFRSGQPEKAIQHEKRCIELAPDDQHFQQQLERFQQAGKE